MSEAKQENQVGCAGGCHHCADAANLVNTGGPAGWRLVLPTILVFLFPLMLALAGAICFRESQNSQAGGAFGGLFLGLAIAVLVRRLSRDKGTE